MQFQVYFKKRRNYKNKLICTTTINNERVEKHKHKWC